MKFLAVGDSFTVGQELQDPTHSWPTVLAQRCHGHVINLAEPGASNDKIVRKTIEYLINPFSEQVDIVVVAWSNLGRQEFADEIGNYDVWPGFEESMIDDDMHWRKDLVRYVSMYHDSTWYLEKFYQQVLLLQSFLKIKNQRYVMLNISQKEYYRRGYSDLKPFYVDQVDRAYFLGFEESGMREWAQHCEQGAGGHFLQDGHAIVAERIYEHIRNLSWVS